MDLRVVGFHETRIQVSERGSLPTTMACSILDDLAAFCANYRTPTIDSFFLGDCVYTFESLHMLIRCLGIQTPSHNLIIN